MRAHPKAWRAAHAWLVAAAGVSLAALVLMSTSDAGAHAGHPQKKLFFGTWYQTVSGGDYASWMNLTTSQFWLDCDGNPGVCGSKWSGPGLAALNDWNDEPMTVDFALQPDQNINYDINIFIEDLLFGDPLILGVAVHYDINGNQCNPDTCVYYYSDVGIGDDAFVGFYANSDTRRVAVIHELGHSINLRHESVNADESVQYECGLDNTGAIPHSVMAYDCIYPVGEGGLAENYVHPWDTCGVNHKYYDPSYAHAGCATDTDADGWKDELELAIGTSPSLRCGVNTWPADINSDNFSDIKDIVFLANYFGQAMPPAPARYNLAPDPLDGFVDIKDIARIAGYFGRNCNSP